MLKVIPDIAKRWLNTCTVPQKQKKRTEIIEMQTPLVAIRDKSLISTIPSRQSPHSSSKNSAERSLPKRLVERCFDSKFLGWRFGALNFAIWTTVVFLVNFIITVWSTIATHKKNGVLFEGDCERVARLNSGLHVLINILSTIILSGSNYCMQVCSAPTREDIDAAHSLANGTWLDIGVPSLRNLRHISWRRVSLWCLMGLSSLPLHLLYNSVIFASTSSNNYVVFSVSQSFINDTKCLNCDKSYPPMAQMLWDKANTGQLQRLHPTDCFNNYAQIIQSDRRNLLLVAGDSNFPPPENNTSGRGSRVYSYNRFEAESASNIEMSTEAYEWMCSGYTTSTDDYRSCSALTGDIKRQGFDPWRVDYFPVEYCLSEQAEPHCKLYFEPGIAIVVTVLNLVKAALMFFIAFRVYDDPLITIGDALASFLNKPDPTTTKMCLLSKQDVKRNQDGYTAGPRQYVDRQYRWKDATSKTRRTVTLVICLIMLGVVACFLGLGVAFLPAGTAIAQLSFGGVDPRTCLTLDNSSMVALALIANTPQLMLSFIYFSINSLFTGMLSAYEWMSYAHKRKGLRVSDSPTGEQRSTYFLQLPYRFSIPLITLSGTLHWLVSQSIFLVAIDYYDENGHPIPSKIDHESGFRALGYSPIAIIGLIVLGSVTVASIVGFGFLPYKRGMTLAGSCSTVISAACHTVDEDRAAELRVQWGVVSIDSDGIGHCTFSSKEVKTVSEGEIYH
ncbi:hypothetical protein M3J09_013016 [Ascochyta lentis]